MGFPEKEQATLSSVELNKPPTAVDRIYEMSEDVPGY